MKKFPDEFKRIDRKFVLFFVSFESLFVTIIVHFRKQTNQTNVSKTDY